MDRRDDWHERVRTWWEAASADVRLPVSALTELCYLVGMRAGPDAEVRLVRQVADGEFPLEQFEEDDLGRAADLMAAYADLPLGFVDASVVAIAERLDVPALLTTDRKHFSVIRPAHIPRFRLLP